jgi:hypothetical protein
MPVAAKHKPSAAEPGKSAADFVFIRAAQVLIPRPAGDGQSAQMIASALFNSSNAP